MTKLVKCKACTKEISKATKACPSCGEPNKKKWGCGSILLILLLVFFIFPAIFQINKMSGSSDVPGKNQLSKQEKQEIDQLVKAADEAMKWQYSSRVDDMRNTKYEFATKIADTVAHFDFPYEGGSLLKLIIRKKDDRLDAVYFVIDKGQFRCGIRECKGAIRFDKSDQTGKVERLILGEPQSHTSDTLFIIHPEWFMKKLKNAESIMVELPFHNYGKKQFVFDVKNLE